jgi:hypothetical protein
LTAPVAAAEDAEKTAVFLYSKVKDRARPLRLSDGVTFGRLLHYNVAFPRQFGRRSDLPGRFVSDSEYGTA